MIIFVGIYLLSLVASVLGYAPTEATLTSLRKTSQLYVSSTVATPPPTMIDRGLLGEGFARAKEICPLTCQCQHNEMGYVSYARCINVTDFDILNQFHEHHLSKLYIENCVIDNSTKLPNLQKLSSVKTLSFESCENILHLFDDFRSLQGLTSLTITNSALEEVNIDCSTLKKLEHLDLSGNKLTEINSTLATCEQTIPLKSLNLFRNSFHQFDWNHLLVFPNLEKLNLSNNVELTSMISTEFKFHTLESLDLSFNSNLETICNNVLYSLPNLKYFDLAETGLLSLPTQIFKLSNLEVLKIHSFTPECNCEMAYLVQQHTASNLFKHFEHLECKVSLSQNKLAVIDPIVFEMLNCTEAVITNSINDSEIHVNTEVLLDCSYEGYPPPSVLWLTPRYELLRLKPDMEETCVPVEDEIILSHTIEDYSKWKHHFSVLSNGSLFIDKFGWRDRGYYQCYVDNNFGNFSVSVNLSLNYEYRNIIYYWSLVYGFSTAAGFLALTLLGKLIHHLLWNYGCCYCCACCHSDPPPKTKRLAAVVDSIETYRIQQLEKLRENYTQQSQRIRDNYTMQLQNLRENYTSQTKGMRNYSAEGYNNIKEQYCDNINRIREYSNGQLTRCHENYIFQRQRLRKFSAANYLKIRETGKYTQKTLNRVIENMPALYVDLTSCRQGDPDWDTDDLEGAIPQLEMTDMASVGESQSIYFTPAGTPLRDGPYGHIPSDNPAGNPYSPVYSPSPEGKSGRRKSHKRMVSNLSSFLPFWWGMGQSDPEVPGDSGTTVAIVEHNHNHSSDDGAQCLNVTHVEDIKMVIKDGQAEEMSKEGVNETANAAYDQKDGITGQSV